MRNHRNTVRATSFLSTTGAVSAASVFLLVGCGSDSEKKPPVPDATVDVNPPDTSAELKQGVGDGGTDGTAANQCVLQGKTYAYGESVKVDCNTCTCGLYGDTSMPCTAMGCQIDASAPPGQDASTDLGGADGSGGSTRPTDEASCLKATEVPSCDPGVPATSVQGGAGGPLLARVEVTAGSCTANSCASSGCAGISVYGQTSQYPGSSCDLLVTAMDGRQQAIRLTAISNPSPLCACCGYPLDPHNGMWANLAPLSFSPAPVAIDFTADGGLRPVDGR